MFYATSVFCGETQLLTFEPKYVGLQIAQPYVCRHGTTWNELCNTNNLEKSPIEHFVCVCIVQVCGARKSFVTQI